MNLIREKGSKFEFESHQETEKMMQYLEILQMKKEDDKKKAKKATEKFQNSLQRLTIEQQACARYRWIECHG